MLVFSSLAAGDGGYSGTVAAGIICIVLGLTTCFFLTIALLLVKKRRNTTRAVERGKLELVGGYDRNTHNFPYLTT